MNALNQTGELVLMHATGIFAMNDDVEKYHASISSITIRGIAWESM